NQRAPLVLDDCRWNDRFEHFSRQERHCLTNCEGYGDVSAGAMKRSKKEKGKKMKDERIAIAAPTRTSDHTRSPGRFADLHAGRDATVAAEEKLRVHQTLTRSIWAPRSMSFSSIISYPRSI